MPPKQQQQQQKLTEHQKEVLQQIKKIGPKQYYFFQWDGFGIILCTLISILGLVPCIGFASISYTKGTTPDTNEDLRILILVAPTVFLFSTAFCLYRLTNRRYPWTEVVFDFLEGSVVYRSSVGLKFMMSSFCNICCCGCFCFLQDELTLEERDEEEKKMIASGNNDSFFARGSYQRNRALFSEIKEIGVGRKFILSSGETEYVVGLKVIRKKSALKVEKEIRKAHDEKYYYLYDSDGNRTKTLKEKNIPKKNNNYDSAEGALSEEMKDQNNTQEQDDDEALEEEQRRENEEKERLLLQHHVQNHHRSSCSSKNKSETTTSLTVPLTRGDDDNEAYDEDDEVVTDEIIDLVPLDVCTSKEGVKETVRFWRRWMRKHYDSVARNKRSEELEEQVEERTNPSVVVAVRSNDADDDDDDGNNLRNDETLDNDDDEVDREDSFFDKPSPTRNPLVIEQSL